ncbi:hypothetical protein BU15DRAFT_79710 [Melanogaster broomeanus]|nr:hypothetical protein BU15DRAFT_79710 [Melanogaster broomeanus]
MPDSLSWLGLVLLSCGILTLPAFAQQSVVLSSTNPDIIYNPPLCTPSSVITGCVSPWQISNESGTTVVFTNGPIPEAGDVIPQMFLSFRASNLSLQTTSLSNATINFTLTAEPTDISITAELNTTIFPLIVVANLPETQTTTLGITFLPGDLPARFDVESITLVVANASATSSFLPSPSLPVSSSPPTFNPLPSATQSSSSNTDETGIIIGATLGSVFGVLLIAVACLVVYRKYRRRGS